MGWVFLPFNLCIFGHTYNFPTEVLKTNTAFTLVFRLRDIFHFYSVCVFVKHYLFTMSLNHFNNQT
jgi:hypothetical protein